MRAQHPNPPSGPDHPRSRPGAAVLSNRANRSSGTRGAGRVQAAWASLAAVLHDAGRRALVASTGETGRRLAGAVALTVVLAVLVGTLYDRGEVPVAAAQPAVGADGGTPARPAAPARSGTAPRGDPASLGGLRGRERPSPVGERPAAVAAAWYAARQGVPRARVKPLQQDRLSAREVRVLVLADHGRGRLRTALVRVRLGRDGWRVR